MATPMAIGTPTKPTAKRLCPTDQAHHAPVALYTIYARIAPTTPTEVGKTIHLICWCSTPLARRKRKNREANAKPPRTPFKNATTRALTRAATLSKPSIPRGFSIGQTSQIGPGNNAPSTTPTVAAIPTSQAKFAEFHF
jgi:hypothetical protein